MLLRIVLAVSLVPIGSALAGSPSECVARGVQRASQIAELDKSGVSRAVVPKVGPKVVIGVLARTSDGQEVLALGQQIGGGHIGLLNSVRERAVQPVTDVLWAGELRLMENRGVLRISEANETAGLLNPAEEQAISATINCRQARVQNLKGFLNKPENRHLRAEHLRTLKFSENPEHLDPRAVEYSDVRHSIVNIQMDWMLKMRAFKNSAALTREAEIAALGEVARETKRIAATLESIAAQTGKEIAELREIRPLIAQMIAGRQPLSWPDYQNVASRVGQFFRNYRGPTQIVLGPVPNP